MGRTTGLNLSTRRKKNRGGERLAEWRILRNCTEYKNRRNTKNHLSNLEQLSMPVDTNEEDILENIPGRPQSLNSVGDLSLASFTRKSRINVGSNFKESSMPVDTNEEDILQNVPECSQSLNAVGDLSLAGITRKSSSINVGSNFKKSSMPVDTNEEDILQNIPECSQSLNAVGDLSLVGTTRESSRIKVSLTGRRIVDISHLFNEIKNICEAHSPFDCTFKDMVFEKESVHGLRSCFTFRCQMCGILKAIWSESESEVQMNINASAVIGIMNAGSGFTGLQQVLGAMNIPCMSLPTYSSYHDAVCDSWEKTTCTEMKEAVSEKVNFTQSRGDIDQDGIPLLTVVADESWAKRSYRADYNSLSGVMGDKSLTDGEVMDKNDEHPNIEFANCGLIDGAFIKLEPEDVNINVIGTQAVETEIVTSAVDEEEKENELQIEDIFVKEEMCLNSVKDELLDSPVSTKDTVIGTQSMKTEIVTSKVDEEEKEDELQIEDIFVKEEMCLNSVKDELLDSPVSTKDTVVKEEFGMQCQNIDEEMTPGIVKGLEPLVNEGCLRNNDKVKTSYSDLCEIALSSESPIITHVRNNSVMSENLSSCSPVNESSSKKSDSVNRTGGKHVCDICSKAFFGKSGLVKHIRTHTCETPFHCNICNKSFTQKASLTRHIQTHTGDKPFQCNICNRSFTQNVSLTRHIHTHTEDKPFHCNICNKSFTQKVALTTHIHTHTGEKPLHCNICNKSFSNTWHLNRHIKTHTGEKAFHCEICNNSFNDKSYFHLHMQTHTGEKPFHCDVCDRSFSRRWSLRQHIQTHTGQ